MPDQLIINPFDTSGYDLATMTTAINLLPNQYGRVRQLGLFMVDPVRTRTVILEELNGILTLLKTQTPGAPAPKMKNAKAKMRSLVVPHIPVDGVILPSDLQGRRDPGSIEPKTLEAEMTKVLRQLRGSLAITEEHLMMGAVKGIILDADGSTLYNLYDEFDITAKTVDFNLDSDATKVVDKCREVVRHIEDNLLGDIMSGVRCLCDETFFDALIAHENVEKFYAGHVAFLQNAGVDQDPRKAFRFGGITFEEYRAKATNATGATIDFISAGDAHFFPVGTQSTFQIHYAPADYFETVNTHGMPIYAKQVMTNDGKRVDVLAESNPLPLCRRPGVLVKGTLT
jgi:hypothetical protein